MVLTSTTADATSVKGKNFYTLGELMVASAAREIRDGEVVFVGMRLPLIAFGVIALLIFFWMAGKAQ